MIFRRLFTPVYSEPNKFTYTSSISAFDFLKNVPASVILLFLIFILLWAIESSCLLLYYEYRTTTYKRYNKHNGIEIFLVVT